MAAVIHPSWVPFAAGGPGQPATLYYTCFIKSSELFLSDAALGWHQASGFGKYRPTIREDMMHHTILGLGYSSSGNSSNSFFILGCIEQAQSAATTIGGITAIIAGGAIFLGAVLRCDKNC
jgi:hypothetical protein